MTTPADPLPGAPPPIPLMQMARDVLALVVDGFTARDVTLPPRRYVAPGAAPAYDDPQVTVNVANLTPGRAAAAMPMQEPAGTFQYASFTITIVRPVDIGDDGNPPTVTAAELGAEAIAGDVATLYDVLTTARWRDMWGENAPVAILDVHTDGPLGGVAATVASLQVQVF